MPFWSKSQEKPAEDPAADRAPEPSDEPISADPGQSEPSHAAPSAATNTPAPEDKDAASAPSGSTWGSRLNTAKQLYGTANQVYTVAQAVPQARAALEPYLTKASTTEDPKSETVAIAESTDSTQGTLESPPQTEKEASDIKSESHAADDTPEIETPPQPLDETELQGDATKVSSESPLEGEETQEDTAEGTAAVQDAESPNPTPEAKAEELTGSPNPPGTNLSSTSARSVEVATAQDSSSKDIASQDGADHKDATPMDAETRTKAEAPEISEEGIGSATEKQAETAPTEDAASGDAAGKDTTNTKDVSAAPSGTEAEEKVPKTFRKGLVFARERAEKDSPDMEAASNDTSVPGEAPAVHAGKVPEAEDEAPDTNDKTLNTKEDTPSASTEEQPHANDEAAQPITMVNEESISQSEPSSGKSAPEVPESTGLPGSEKPDTPPAPESDTTRTPPASNPISQPEHHSIDTTDARPVSSTHNVESTQDSEATSDTRTPSEPPTNDESSSKPTQTGSATQETQEPSSAEAQTSTATPDQADGSEPVPATQQPTPEEVEKAAEAAKAAARLQSTADTLWAQARAVRDPAERERLWRAAYNKEVEAHGQSKKARTMASGWGQGVLSGVGISAAVGVGLGNVVGALLSGVVSVPGSLIGAGVGAAMGPLVKLGGYGGKDEKSKEKERPKEFDWEEDLSDDEEHQQIVDAVRKDEATAKGDTKAEEST
ncbi:hypothetical protein N0V82_010707 [Gnomoniopsis sp. IMI 355080]|nr:hypothetical protein N0V82_010707 [Gnomoniopsis sp. IMI 355080]